jgi:hypothetical protein
MNYQLRTKLLNAVRYTLSLTSIIFIAAHLIEIPPVLNHSRMSGVSKKQHNSVNQTRKGV